MHVIMEFTSLPAVFLILFSLFAELWSFQSGFYADNGLQQTVLLNRLPHRQRKEMQQEILTLLGLHHRPKPSRHPKVRSAPQFMMDLYNSMERDPENEHENRLNHKQLHVNISQGTARIIDTADMIMSFINQAPNHHFLRHDVSRRFLFDFSEVPAGEVVTAAEFRLFKQPGPGWLGHRYINIHVYRVRQGQDLEDRLLELESNVTVKGEYRGWLELDVTRAAAEWNAYPTSNLGILVVVMDPDGNEVAPHRVGLVDYRGPEEKQPFMLACFKSYTTLHSRSKRSPRKRKRKNQEVSYNDAPTWDLSFSNERYNKRACQRRALYVSFRELGWQDWIIAPDGYGAFYCYGGCSFPLNAQMNATNHAIVQTLVHLMNPFYVPKPCCAPTELSAISVLFFDDKYNVVLKKYKNMVVEACGCH